MSKTYCLCELKEGIVSAISKAHDYIDFSKSMGDVLSVKYSKSDNKPYYTISRIHPAVNRVVTKYNIDHCLGLREFPVEVSMLSAAVIKEIKEKDELSLMMVMLDSDISKGLEALLCSGEFTVGLLPKGTEPDCDCKILLFTDLVEEPDTDIDELLNME